jgi:uncharacterized membrane protein
MRNDKASKRPVAITIVGLIAVIAALVYFLRAFLLLESLKFFEKGLSGPVFQGYTLTETGAQWVNALYYLLVSIVAYLIAIGLLSMRRWSWIAFMSWAGFNMVVGLLHHFYNRSDSNYVYLFLSVVVVFILNQAEVQRLFGVQSQVAEDFDDA